MARSATYDTTGNTRIRPTSFDSGYEHSVEHWLELATLVEDAAEEEVDVPVVLVS